MTLHGKQFLLNHDGLQNHESVVWLWYSSIYTLHTRAVTYTYTHVPAHLTRAKLKILVCARTVAHDFYVHTRDSKHTRHTRDTHYELALGLPHYTCGITTGTVAVGSEIQLLFS